MAKPETETNAPPGAREDGDSAGRLSRFPGLLLPASAVIAGSVLIGTEFLDTFRLVNPEGDVVDVAGGVGRHGFSLGLMGVLGIVLAAIAALTDSRPAALGCAAAGLVALALIAVIDIPDIGATDLVADPDDELTNAEAEPTGALWLSAGAAFLLLGSGAWMALYRRDRTWR